MLPGQLTTNILFRCAIFVSLRKMFTMGRKTNLFTIILTTLSLSTFISGQILYCQKNIFPEPFRKISFDQKLGRLFVASRNKVFELYPSNLSIVVEQSLAKTEEGDCGFGSECFGNLQDFNTQVLSVDSKNQNLIVCGSSKSGTCHKINLDGLTLTDESIDGVVSPDKNRTVHSAMFPQHSGSGHQLIIGNSAVPNPRTVEENHLKFITSFLSDSLRKEFDIPYFSSFISNPSRLDVLGSFKHSGNTYIVINRVENGELASRIVRICDRSPTLKSLLELRLECSAGDGINLNYIAVALEKTFLSEKMAEAQKIVAEEVLFVLFSNSNSSAICVYKLDLIVKVFNDLVQGCSEGKAGFYKGLYYLNGENKTQCQPEPIVKDSWNFCGDVSNFPMSSDTIAIKNILEHSFYPIDAAASSFLVTAANDYNVAFVATERKSIIKVKMPTSALPSQLPLKASSSSSYDEWSLPFIVDSKIKEMAFDASEGFYVMEENSICQMKRAVCNHTTCDTCIVDPYCGWCLDSLKCSQRASCPKQHLWFSDKCPTMTNLAPKKMLLHEFSIKKIRMDAINVPDKFGRAFCNLTSATGSHQTTSYNAQVDVLTSSTSLASGVSTFICKEFSRQPTNWNGNAFINLTLTLVIDNVGWLSESLFVYDCQKFKSCSGCLSEEVTFPCNWCTGSHTCISETESACHPRFLSTGNPLVKKADECPSIDLDPTQPSILHSDDTFNYRLIGRNVKDHYKSGLKCKYEMDSTPILSLASVLPTSSSMDNSCVILCSEIMLKYDEAKASQVVSVDVTVDAFDKVLDNPKSVNLTLYKCQYMASSCGKCLLLDPEYKCVWCEAGGFCGKDTSCPSYLNKSSICPNPSINEFKPAGGPVQGGTKLTITGINLGMKAEDIQVFLGTRECKVIPDGYQPSEVVICNTSSAVKPESVNIEIKVKNQHTCTSKLQFQYKNPELKDFSPKRGMKSGGTIVCINGMNLDFGSRYLVTIGEKRSKEISHNSTHICVVTSVNSISKKVPVKVKVDGHELPPLKDHFEYLNNPDISGISPKVSLMSGGRQISISGRSLDIISKAQLVVNFADEAFVTNCTVKSPTAMLCPTPDLSKFENYFSDQVATSSTPNDFGFILDDVLFPFDRDYLGYYPHPTLKHLDGIVVVRDLFEEVKVKTEKSDWLGEFHPDIKVAVGPVTCSHAFFDSTASTINFKPMDCPVKGQDDKVFPIKVKINNFSEEVGRIRFPVPFRAGLVIGLILGLLIPIIIGAILFAVWYSRRVKRMKVEKRRQRNPEAAAPMNQTPSRAGNPYEGLTTSAEETIPLTEVIDPNAYQDDARYLEALLNRLDSQSMRNAAKEVYIARDRLEIGNQLGKGHFGCVYAATLRDSDLKNPVPVAVKTIDDADLDQKMMEGFLKEGIIMKNFNHPHVLSLLGLCLGYKKEPMVILPFMANGDLRSYVKAKNRSFTARQLLQLAQQVAEGMSYLASLNFIHRDLAARNCMIDDKSQVKVADFGLSHELHDREYYSSKNRRAKLPIKWMALESLENYVFTIKSDVWSFGVLLWELMTRGITPYPDVDVFETRNYLASGRRLFKPKFCPENVYNVMLDCWQESPERRPTFTDLVNRLELLLNPPKHNSGNSGRNYINIQNPDPAQDYLKPISSPPEDDQNHRESHASVPTNQEEDSNEEDPSSHSSLQSGGSVKVSLVKNTPGVKEASV